MIPTSFVTHSSLSVSSSRNTAPLGPADAERRQHGHVHVIFPHNAVRRGGDAHGDHVLRGLLDAAFPGALTLLLGEDGSVGALAELRAGA